jgi:proline-specific peptidase
MHTAFGRRDFLGMVAAVATASPALAIASQVFAGPQTFPVPDRELMVEAPGGRLYVRINGRLEQDRLPIVMIHGGPGGTHMGFLDGIDLAKNRALILYDQLDCGLSDRPNDPANWTVPRFVDEVEAIRKALGIRRWHVLGHSWGGTIALEYGARRPLALAGLVLASPLISTHRWIADAQVLRHQLPREVQTQLSRCESAMPLPRANCDAATEVYYRNFMHRESMSEAWRSYHPPGDRGFNLKLYETMWGPSEFTCTGTLRSYDGEPLLARLDGTRTLLLVGQYDEARPATALAYAQRVKGAEIGVVPGSGHSIFSDRPDETVAVLRSWLSRQDRMS